MNPGSFNKKIVIQHKSFIENENGFEIESWLDLKKVWAKVENISGKELIEAQQLKSKTAKRVYIRYIKELDSSINPEATLQYRILYKNNVYNLIYSENLKEENKYLEMLMEGI